MQNMCVDKLIEIVKAKNFIKFHSKKIMIHLGWVANSMVIFSASYKEIPVFRDTPDAVFWQQKLILNI